MTPGCDVAASDDFGFGPVVGQPMRNPLTAPGRGQPAAWAAFFWHRHSSARWTNSACQGGIPMHPELLDFLRCETEWTKRLVDQKSLHRLIVTSQRTYQQSRRSTHVRSIRWPERLHVAVPPPPGVGGGDHSLMNASLAAAGVIRNKNVRSPLGPPQPEGPDRPNYSKIIVGARE